MGKQDALESAKIGTDGESANKQTHKELARKLLADAVKAMPTGVQANSPFADMSRDAMLAESNRSGLTVAVLLSTDELRVVLEHQRQVKIATTPVAGTPVGGKPRAAPPPVPPPAPKRRSVRGLKPSPTGKWIVRLPNTPDGRQQRTLSIGGQVVTLRTGAVIEARHYEDFQLQAMIDQGVDLEPLEADQD